MEGGYLPCQAVEAGIVVYQVVGLCQSFGARGLLRDDGAHLLGGKLAAPDDARNLAVLVAIHQQYALHQLAERGRFQ